MVGGSGYSRLGGDFSHGTGEVIGPRGTDAAWISGEMFWRSGCANAAVSSLDVLGSFQSLFFGSVRNLPAALTHGLGLFRNSSHHPEIIADLQRVDVGVGNVKLTMVRIVSTP
jgi:hypothetical protein